METADYIYISPESDLFSLITNQSPLWNQIASSQLQHETRLTQGVYAYVHYINCIRFRGVSAFTEKIPCNVKMQEHWAAADIILLYAYKRLVFYHCASQTG